MKNEKLQVEPENLIKINKILRSIHEDIYPMGDIINLLVELGGDPNMLVTSTYDILTMSPERAKDTLGRELYKVEPNFEIIKTIVEHSQIDKNARINDYEGLVSFLFEFAYNPRENWLSIDVKDRTELLKTFINNPEIDVNLQNEYGYTALMMASELGRTEIVRMLLEKPEILVNVQNRGGETALMIASGKGNIQIVRMLLERPEIDVNLQTKGGRTALSMASGSGYTEVVRMLLERPEIDVNLQDEYGWTALMNASRWGYTEIVRMLLERPEIDIRLKDNLGRTAWTLGRHDLKFFVPHLRAKGRTKKSTQTAPLS